MAAPLGSGLTGLGNVATAGQPPGGGGGGGAFPGFGPAPPAVAAAGSAGVAGTASRSDHTHAGVTSVVGSDGITPAVTSQGAVTVGQRLVAQWTIGTATRRFFAVDFVGGNDASAGFSDVSMAAAGAVAKKTLAGLAAVFPSVGAGRSAEIAIRNGGVNTTQAYTDGIAALLQNCTGYAVNSPIVRGTGTNTTAGAVAFAGDTADVTFCGGITVPGLNGPGYNPTGAPTTQVVQCLKVGGAAPAFPAEPADPLGWRIRFDSATTTAALRNVCRTIAVVTTDTITTSTVLPAVPIAADVFYVEKAGVSVASSTIAGSPGNGGAAGTRRGIQIAGIELGTFATEASGASLIFCGGAAVTFDSSNIDVTPTLIHPLANITIGGGLKSSAGIGSVRGGNFTFQAMVSTAATQFQRPHSLDWGVASVAGAGLRVDGGFQGESTGSTFGSLSGAIPCRVLGTGAQLQGMLLVGGFFRLGNIAFTGMGAKPGVQLGIGAITWQAPTTTLSGTTGNTDIGFQFTDSTLCVYWLQGNTNTLSGTAGDVRVKTPTGTAIVTWAQTVATGIADGSGNRIVNIVGPLAMVASFASVSGNAAIPTTSYMDGSGANGVGNVAQPYQYPTSLRLITRLRLGAPTGTGASPPTATLMKNGVATAMTCTLGAGAAAGTNVSDVAHPILFLDGDTFDVRLTQAIAAEGPECYVATLEGPV